MQGAAAAAATAVSAATAPLLSAMGGLRNSLLAGYGCDGCNDSSGAGSEKKDVPAYELRPSHVHGTGVFAARDLGTGERVGLAIRLRAGLVPQVTQDLGRWLNHSQRPNAVLLWEPHAGGHVVRTSAPVPRGSELLVDYASAPWYIDKHFIGGPYVQAAAPRGGGGGGGGRGCKACRCMTCGTTAPKPL